MIEQGDPIALPLLAKYNNLAMPNMRLNQMEATDLLDYIDTETNRVSLAKSQSSANDVVGRYDPDFRFGYPTNPIRQGGGTTTTSL